jgi:hypothetical protein
VKPVYSFVDLIFVARSRTKPDDAHTTAVI